ncbi:MAG: hypothetical protein BroJett015_27040 [Chloroflexota bacterium]|nr:MAG: hypothetical protein BroJett015_27040 [Chloroflexota bacterium]
MGRSRGGFSTKIHVNVDSLGNPLYFLLTGGERHDCTQAEALIADLDFERLLADKSYDVEPSCSTWSLWVWKLSSHPEPTG